MSLERTFSYQFIKRTNLSLSRLGEREISLEPALPYKSYPQAEKIELKIKDFPETENFFNILAKRRSNRRYRRGSITLEEISSFMFCSSRNYCKSGLLSFKNSSFSRSSLSH